jgi:hypothetical protein
MAVFIVQKQMRFDHQKGELVPKFPSIDKAEQFGKFVYLLSPTASPFNAQKLVDEMTKKLENFGNEDYLLLIGNPVLIGMASGIAADRNLGMLHFLQWSGRDSNYVPIHVRLY